MNLPKSPDMVGVSHWLSKGNQGLRGRNGSNAGGANDVKDGVGIPWKDPPPKSDFGLVTYCKTKSSWKFNHGNVAHEEIVNFYLHLD